MAVKGRKRDIISTVRSLAVGLFDSVLQTNTTCYPESNFCNVHPYCQFITNCDIETYLGRWTLFAHSYKPVDICSYAPPPLLTYVRRPTFY